MPLSLKWMRDYIDLDNVTIKEITAALLASGIETRRLSQKPSDKLLDDGINGTVLGLDIPAHRFDCYGLLGCSRELAARLGKPWHWHGYQVKRDAKVMTAQDLRIELEAERVCSRVVVLRVENVRPVPSPLWLRERLTSVGIAPIDLITDATTYAMLEFHQPIHCIDQRRVQGSILRVTEARAEEKRTTILGEKVEVKAGDLLVVDGENNIAQLASWERKSASVMDDTRSILIVGTSLYPAFIPPDAHHCGRRAEAKLVFDRGTDPTNLSDAVLRVAALICQSMHELYGVDESIPPPRIAKDTIDLGFRPGGPRLIALRLSHARDFLGLKDLSRSSVIDSLGRFFFRFVDGNEDRLVFEIPAFRCDIDREIDLIAELVLIRGMDTLTPEPLPPLKKSFSRKKSFANFIEQIKDTAWSSGLQEVFPSPFACLALYKTMGLFGAHPLAPHVHVTSRPLAIKQTLATSLMPQLLQTLVNHSGDKIQDTGLFAVGKGYSFALPGKNREDLDHVTDAETETSSTGIAAPRQSLPTEKNKLCGILLDSSSPSAGKLILNNIMHLLLVGPLEESILQGEVYPFLDIKGRWTLSLCGDAVGFFGILSSDVCKDFPQIKDQAFVFELDLDRLYDLTRKNESKQAPTTLPI